MTQAAPHPDAFPARAGVSALAGAFVLPGAETGPTGEMLGAGESAHVRSNVREEPPCRDVADSGNRAEPHDGIVDWRHLTGAGALPLQNFCVTFRTHQECFIRIDTR